jgi:hypothetical protein
MHGKIIPQKFGVNTLRHLGVIVFCREVAEARPLQTVFASQHQFRSIVVR